MLFLHGGKHSWSQFHFTKSVGIFALDMCRKSIFYEMRSYSLNLGSIIHGKGHCTRPIVTYTDHGVMVKRSDSTEDFPEF